MSAAGAMRPLSHEEIASFSWSMTGPARAVMEALDAARPGASRFVGGCVRDSLVGARPKDFDIATMLRPEEVMQALAAAGLRAVPTGLAHGTVTGVAEGTGVEVTTLRSDVETDGRRATVAFSDDWFSDAARRDFRLNAIYLTPDGRLFDPVGGVADAREGRVCFIGEPEDRIREDYLRILRFFRFSARFSQEFDPPGLAACARLKAGIGRLSAERVGDEMFRILALPRAAFAVDGMMRAGVLEEVWPQPIDLDALAALKKADPGAEPPLGLAALWNGRDDGLDARLRLSNADARRRKRALAAEREIEPSTDDRRARAVLYRAGESAWADGLALARARAPNADWMRLASLAERAPPPVFPYTGKDVIAAGVQKGPDVARILAAVESRWIGEDFPSRARLEEILKEEIASAKAT